MSNDVRPSQRVITALDAVTETTTSAPINLAGVKRATLVVTRANHSSGSSAFSVTVSADGSTYVAYNKLIDNVTNAISENLTRVASKTLSTNTSATLSLDLTSDAFAWMKVTATETTDGTHSAKVILSYD